jgi:DNA-binding NarL/FixJ family response regulator
MNGREAIEQARALHSDVLLLDLVMPEMNGFDIAREVAKVEPKVQILLCTVQLSTYVVREAKGSGSAGRCRKTTVRQIMDGIKALLRHETFYCWPAD